MRVLDLWGYWDGSLLIHLWMERLVRSSCKNPLSLRYNMIYVTRNEEDTVNVLTVVTTCMKEVNQWTPRYLTCQRDVQNST